MKKIIFTFCIAIIILLLPQISKAQTEYRLDSLQSFAWDHALLPDDWLMQVRWHYNYNNGGVNFTNLLQLIKDSGIWLNSYQEIRTYNVDDKLESKIIQYWIGDQWVNFIKQEYTYDGSGNNDLITTYSPNGMDWILITQQLLTYNSSDLITEDITQQWIGTWTNSQKITYTYDVDLLMQIEYYNWVVTDWAATANIRNIYTYNVSDQVETDTQEFNNGGGWLNASLQTYTYTGDNILDIITQFWNSAWVNSSQQVHSYDVNDLPDEFIFNFWSESSWMAQSKIIFFFNEVALNVTTDNLFEGKSYPNPFNNELTISLKSALETKGTLQIFDLQGKELSKIGLNQGVKTIKLNNPYLSKGVYFIKVTSASQNHTFKVIKQ